MDFTKEQLAESIRKTGCDVVLILALLDSKVVESYNPVSYHPMNDGYYGNFYGYYNHYHPRFIHLVIIQLTKTFYLETNPSHTAKDKLVRQQSEARNPNDLQDWFRDDSVMLMNHLKSKV